MTSKTDDVERTYINIQSIKPSTESIQQGHDKVTRYVRDPTMRMVRTD